MKSGDSYDLNSADRPAVNARQVSISSCFGVGAAKAGPAAISAAAKRMVRN